MNTEINSVIAWSPITLGVITGLCLMVLGFLYPPFEPSTWEGTDSGGWYVPDVDCTVLE